MKAGAPRLIPAVVAFPEDAARCETWGRLLALGPERARLSTRARLSRGELVYLDFELPGERFRRLRASVLESRDDEDGYTLCELGFLQKADRVRLGRRLRELVTQSHRA